MPRNTVKHPTEALYASVWATGKHFSSIPQNNNWPTGNIGDNWVYQLHRIQSVNYGFRINRTPINQMGESASIDYIQLESPTVTLEFDYVLANLHNEKVLGFAISGDTSALSGILTKVRDEKNYFIKTVAEGFDAIGDTTNNANVSVIGVGNAYVASYSVQAGVGNLPTVSVGVEGLNMTFATGVIGNIPAVNQSNGTRVSGWIYSIPPASGDAGAAGTDLDISALRPGDITISFARRQAEDEGDAGAATLSFDTVGLDVDDAHIQSFTLGYDLSREAIQKLGQRFAYSREVQLPVNIDFSMDAIVSDLTTGSLGDLINCDNSYDITVKLFKPDNCLPNVPKTIIAQYALKNAKLVDEQFSSSIGSNKTCRLNFTSQIGGPNQTSVGLFMSGLAPNYVYQQG
jgi:hypothetical protein